MSCEYRIEKEEIYWGDDKNKVKKLGGFTGVAIAKNEARKLCQVLIDLLDAFPACPHPEKSSKECDIAQTAKK